MKKVIKSDRVRVEEGAATPRSRPRQVKSGPDVRLLRASGRLEAIHFTCTCGRESVLELEYEGDGSAGSTTDKAS